MSTRPIEGRFRRRRHIILDKSKIWSIVLVTDCGDGGLYRADIGHACRNQTRGLKKEAL